MRKINNDVRFNITLKDRESDLLEIKDKEHNTLYQIDLQNKVFRYWEFDDNGKVKHYSSTMGLEQWYEYDKDGYLIHYTSNEGDKHLEEWKDSDEVKWDKDGKVPKPNTSTCYLMEIKCPECKSTITVDGKLSEHKLVQCKRCGKEFEIA